MGRKGTIELFNVQFTFFFVSSRTVLRNAVFPNPKFNLQLKLNQHRLGIVKNGQNQPAVITVKYKTHQMTDIKSIIIIIGTLVRSCIRQLAQVSQSSVSRLGLNCCWC